jgi:hypothetical protein
MTDPAAMMAVEVGPQGVEPIVEGIGGQAAITIHYNAISHQLH